MRILIRLWLLFCLCFAIVTSLEKELPSSQAQSVNDCPTCCYNWSADPPLDCPNQEGFCLGSTVPVTAGAQAGDGLKSYKIKSVPCNFPDCGSAQNVQTAVDNPYCCDRDQDGYNRPGCGGGTDCNDADSSIHPNATEICNDGVDNDCDGQIDCNDGDCLNFCCDHDGDGYWSVDCYGDDCDDNDSSVHPNATEICGNGKDDDCQDGDAGANCEIQLCDIGTHWLGCPICCCVNDYTHECLSPVLIDVQGDGFALTDGAHGVRFDLNADGFAEHLSWTTANSDDAFLVLDRNGNGTVDNGTELFGTVTPQPTPAPGVERNGFLALAEYDKAANGGNGDGLIDRHDAIFSSLRLWQDANHNGFSEPSELHRMGQVGLKTIDLDYKKSRKTDQYGNKFRYRAKVKDTHDAQLGRWAWDVFLVQPVAP